MEKRAYISIEGEKAFIYTPKDSKHRKGRHYRVDIGELFPYLIREEIKNISLCLFMEGLQVIRLPIQARIATLKRNESLIKSMVRTEIQKRFPGLADVAYVYRVQESGGRAWITIYIAPRENIKLAEELIIEGFDLFSCYPIFFPVMEYITDVDQELSPKMILFVSERTRFLFVTEGRDLLLQRKFEGESEYLTQEDVLNINMTANYAIQNLRLRISEIVILKKQRQDIDGLSLPTKFIYLKEAEDLPIIPLLITMYEKKLRGMELFLPEYREYNRVQRYVSHAKKLLVLSLSVLIVILASTLIQYNNFQAKLVTKRTQVYAMKQELPSIIDRVGDVEKKVRPVIELINKKNMIPDSREPLFSLSHISELKDVSVEAVESVIEKSSILKIHGKIKGSSFEQKERSFNQLRTTLVIKGFSILEERWDLIKGEFSVTVQYGA